ncbi:DUF4878 domain-containing protein [Pseudomonas sp. F1_0610]|uniref:DUF4878 domain-containing protein n=1 Tax=Pseudomonas sp. F1_0610 TaxID=3114284 RepID=UPI0039C001F7
MSKILGIFTTLFLLATLTACSGSSPEDVATKFLNAAYKGDADTVLELIHIPEHSKQNANVKELVSGKVKAGVAKSQAKAEQNGGVKNITVKETQMDEANNRGVIILNVEFKKEDSRQTTERIRLIKSDDKWKVSI